MQKFIETLNAFIENDEAIAITLVAVVVIGASLLPFARLFGRASDSDRRP